MKKTTTLLFIGVALLFASCSQVYSPALYHQDIAYQPKPSSFDTVKAATYVSLGFNYNPSNNANDYSPSGQLNISQGYIFNNFNLAYEAFGVLGDYQHDNQTTQTNRLDNFSDKSFGAVGGRASANFFIHNENYDFRFIGLEMAYSHEFGDYADFRKYLNAQTGYFVDPRTDLFTIGLSSEILFNDRKNVGVQHGIRGFLGTTLGDNPLDKTYYANDSANERMFHNLFLKASYFIKFRNYIGSAEVGNGFMIRFGYAF
jgi:hypothetical protein